MGGDVVFFEVVEDEVAVGAEEVGEAPVVGEDVAVEDVDLEAEVDERLGEAELAKLLADLGGAAQDVEAGGAVFARGDAEFEPLVGVVDGEALEGGFVEVVEYLADDAAVFDFDGVEFGAGDGLVDELRHVVLAGFEVEKGWFVVWVLEASFFAEQRPIEFERLAGESGERGDAHGRSGGDVGGAQCLVVALGQGALRDDDEDVVAAHAILLQQPLDPLNGEGGFAASEWSG